MSWFHSYSMSHSGCFHRANSMACYPRAPCNVACGSEIMTVNSPSGSTLQCDVALGWYAVDFVRWQHPAMWHVALGSWHLIRQVATPCNVGGGSGMTCHGIRPNVRFLEFYIWFRFWPYHRSWYVILHQPAKFYPNRTTLSRKKLTSRRFSRWRISTILDFRVQ